MFDNDVRFRLAVASDVEDIYLWRNHPSTRAMSLNKTEIDYEGHKNWFSKALATPEVIMVVAEADEKLGVVRFEKKQEGVVVSVQVSPLHRGQGLAKALLKHGEGFLSEWGDLNLRAIIREENGASIRTFENAGYIRADEIPDDHCLLYLKHKVQL